MPMPVLDAAQTSPPRPTSSSSYHATLISKPVPEVPREYITEDASTPAEVLPRVESPTFHAPPTSISAHEGSRARPNMPPRKSVCVIRSYPILDETTHAPRPVFVQLGDLYRHSSSRYTDSETAWHAHDEREPVRSNTYMPSVVSSSSLFSVWVQICEGNVGQRMAPTIRVATEELAKSTKRCKW